jgi:adenylate cyclase
LNDRTGARLRRPKTRINPLYLPLVAGFLALAVLVRWDDPFFVQALRLIAFDSYQRLAPPAYDPQLPVRVVDIDSESLKRVGQWPWPRTVMRDLLVKLAERDATAIAFDVLFAEPDRTSLEEIIKRLPADQAVRLEAAVGRVTGNDIQFAEALSATPSVLSIVLTEQATVERFEPKAGFVFLGDDPKQFLRSFTGADTNLPVFDNAAKGVGSFNMLPNRDGVVRQVPLFSRLGDQIVPSLAAEALRVAQGASTYVLKSSNASGESAYGEQTGLNHVRIGDVETAVNPDGTLTVKFRKSNPAAFIPAWKVLAGEDDPSQIAGKIVFVGSSAPGLLDLRATPLDPALPGVEVHAQIVEHILSGQSLARADFTDAIEELLIVGLGLLLAILMLRLSPGLAAGIGGLLLVALNAAGWIAYRYFDLLFDPLYPSLVLLLLLAATTFYVYRQVEAQRGQIRGAFSRYLAPAVVEDIIADPSKLELGGEVRELTLMFCDVRNFTAISEGLSAAELTTFINELLTPLSDVVLRERGTIDKYMGDAIMAFWNAPLPMNDHAARACRASVAMIDQMTELNRHWQQRARRDGRPLDRVQIGIGINTGDCCVGNLGSEQRFDYSAIGDEVNVTSRLEGLSKLYGVPVVVGERTVASCPELAVIELDYIKLKGRSKPTRIFTLADTLECGANAMASLQLLHAQCLQAYRAQKWDEADALIGKCRSLGVAALETYYAVFSGRIANLRAIAPPPDWDGAYAMTEK